MASVSPDNALRIAVATSDLARLADSKMFLRVAMVDQNVPNYTDVVSQCKQFCLLPSN